MIYVLFQRKDTLTAFLQKHGGDQESVWSPKKEFEETQNDLVPTSTYFGDEKNLEVGPIFIPLPLEI